MNCPRCGNLIDHATGDMTAVIRCHEYVASPMMLCIPCALKFLDWAEGKA